MIFEQIPVGGDRNFAYLVGDEKSGRAAVVDPAYSPDAVVERARALGLSVEFVLNTHGHHDHAGGNDRVEALTGARVVAPRSMEAADGASISLGSVRLTFLHTPGHTPDSSCILAEGPEPPGKLMTGDTLFVGKVGGTGYGEDARQEYESLHRLLRDLPGQTEVWPGHDVGVAPSSTLDHERRTNPFLLRESFEEFVTLKRNWLEYKRKHGIA
jgi:glyoxylase-like metal-dependent hydrolase (beta-lactamase superfamily II)